MVPTIAALDIFWQVCVGRHFAAKARVELHHDSSTKLTAKYRQQQRDTITVERFSQHACHLNVTDCGPVLGASTVKHFRISYVAHAMREVRRIIVLPTQARAEVA